MNNDAYIDRLQAKVLKVVGEKGYASAEDLMQCVECRPSFIPDMARRLGIAPADVKALAEGQKITPEDVRAVLAA